MSLTATASAADRIEIIDENLKNGYARMPRPVLKAPGLSYRAKCLYCLLLDYTRDKDACFPGQDTLAADLDTSMDTIQRGLQELKDYGLIDIKRQGLNKPNIYFILPLSKCARLRIVPLPAKQETASVPPRTPQNCGNRTPQNCGRKETKTKEIHEQDEDSSKLSQKGRDEGIDAAPAQQTPPAAYSHPPMTTGNQRTPDRNEEKPSDRKPAHQPLHPQRSEPRTLPCIGKPLTQDEIDAKRKAGRNASGLSPLVHIIPPEHWQTLEQQGGKAPVKPYRTHFSVCTKNAPLFIDATIEEFSLLLGDEPDNTALNINRTAKLYRNKGMTEETFREALYEAFNQAKRYSTDYVKKRRADGGVNRMPVFFAILKQRLAQHPS